MMAYADNPGVMMEAGGSRVLFHPQLHRKSEVNLGYIRPCKKEGGRERKRRQRREGIEGEEFFSNLGFNTTQDIIHKRKEINHATSYNILLSAWILNKVRESGMQADHRISGT